MKELVDSGEAEAGEIVLLFAAGTDAEQYEEELRARRAADLPCDRARVLRPAAGGRHARATCACSTTGTTTRRSSPCSPRRLSASRTTASSPSGALRRSGRCSRGSRRGFPEGASERDARLLQAFRQRYDRLAAIAGTVGLERLCEHILVEHDYDLAVLAQWDGRRRYANLRKLARLARSYEELRGPDVEGFVRFVLEQDAAGVKELEAVAEEEGAGRFAC